MLSVCPDLTGSFYYSQPGRGSSHFVAYSSCYCSLSALWDACPDPPWHVTLEMTLSMKLNAGSQASPCIAVSLPLPSLSVFCSSPSISACPGIYIVWLQEPCLSEEFFLSVHEFVVICHSCYTKFLQGLRAVHNPGICLTALWCAVKSAFIMVACQALLFRQYNNQTKLVFFNWRLFIPLLIPLFLTLPVISYVLIYRATHYNLISFSERSMENFSPMLMLLIPIQLRPGMAVKHQGF